MIERSVPHRQGEGECEEAVAAASREERAARSALNRGLTPSHPDWTPSDQDGYEARLECWRAASHALLEVLDRLTAERGETPHGTAARQRGLDR
jgi:hypothetical protein